MALGVRSKGVKFTGILRGVKAEVIGGVSFEGPRDLEE